jgi:hypothetical protein
LASTVAALVMELSFPVFVLAKDSGEISRFESLLEMQHELERIDVENAEYEAWDRDGRPLTLNVQEPTWLKLVPRTIEGSTTTLDDALLSWAKSLGIEPPEPSPKPLELYETIRRAATKSRRRWRLLSLFSR